MLTLSKNFHIGTYLHFFCFSSFFSQINNSTEIGSSWLNLHKQLKADGKLVGGQVWIGDRRRGRKTEGG